jgi:hypothetical protein
MPKVLTKTGTVAGIETGQTSQTFLVVLNSQGFGAERSEKVGFEELNESEPLDEGS